VRKLSQHDLIIQHLVNHSHLTNFEAIGLYRIFNLKGRVTELRGCTSAPERFNKHPVFVETEMRTDGTGKKYARYSLRTSEKESVRKNFPDLFPAEKAAA